MKNWPEFFINQIEKAGTVALSRTQNADSKEVERVAKDIRQLNPNAAIITTPWSALDAGQLLEADQCKTALQDELTEGVCCHHDCANPDCHHHHEEAADSVFAVWSAETALLFDPDQITDVLRQVAAGKFGRVLRAKGILQGQAGWFQFDYVPGEINFKESPPEYAGRLCVIGEEIDKAAIADLFGLA